MDPSASRIVVSAVFDPRAEQVVVAGQVLDGRTGVEGLPLRITLGGRSLDVTTGPHGSFGVRFDAAREVLGWRAVVQHGGCRTACCVH